MFGCEDDWTCGWVDVYILAKPPRIWPNEGKERVKVDLWMVTPTDVHILAMKWKLLYSAS
jgi:hypothetical protein